MKLIKAEFDCSDEFYVYGFCVMSAKECEEYINNIEKKFEVYPEGIELYFGSNEVLFFENFEDFMGEMTITNISQEDFETIKNNFGARYGWFPYFDKI